MDIKEIRKEKKLTQAQSAEKLGISRRSYQTLESEGSKQENKQKYNYYCSILSQDETDKDKSKDNQENKTNESFLTNVIYGEALSKLSKNVKRYNKRSCFKNLLEYINGDYSGRVCILYGLRRTGKTTMLFQLIEELDKRKTAYIKILEKNNMGELIQDINKLTKMGIEYILIDEVTLLEDFINSASALSDIYCQMGQKIVLSGTDSLGFSFAKRDELYDRAITIHTSYISYKEFSKVLNISDIDTYIEYGGTLQKENMNFDDPDSKDDSVSFKEDESTRKYIDSAISRNIQRSLQNDSFGSRFYYLRELYDNHELTNAINRLVENMNHEFLVSVVEETFKSHDLGSARQLLFKKQDDEVQTALSQVNEKEVLSRLKALIEIKEKCDTKVKITQDAIEQIKTYLYDLDLLKDIEVRYDDGKKEKVAVFTQPGMRYSIAKALCYSLMDDDYFSGLTERAQTIIRDTILNDVKGRMLEEIALLESTYRKTSDELVFKYKRRNKPGEIDMVVYNSKDDTFKMYEIKHSKKVMPKMQCKYLNDKSIEEELSKKYGKQNGKYVLFCGITNGPEGDVYYEPINRFLTER